MATKKRRRQAKPTKSAKSDDGRPLPRPFWSGTISFGLVSVPVYLFPASRNVAVRLRMLDRRGAPLSRRFYCPEENVDVHSEHIIRGYEVSPGEYVIVRDDELESLRPRESRDIDLRRFVPLDDVPPLFFERAYFLTPSGDSTKAYRLLADVMERTAQAGIGTFVMRDKEYLAAILAERGILRAQLLRYEDEVRTPDDVGLPNANKPDARKVSAFRKAIRALEADALDPDELRTGFAEKLKQLVEKKLRKKSDVVESPEYEEEEDDDESPIDLLEAIRRSLHGDGAATSGNGRHRRSTGRTRGGDGKSKSSGNGKKRPDDDLEAESKEELYQRAQRLDIPGRSRMSKQQLIRALRSGG